MKKIKKIMAICFIIMIALSASLFAKGSSEESSTDSSGAQMEKSKEKIKIGYCMYFLSPFTSSMKRGAEAAGKDYGIEVEVVAGEKGDTMEQISLFDALVAKGMDAIIITAVDANSWISPVKQAVDRGVLVGFANATARESASSLFVGISGYTDGLVLGEEILNMPEMKNASGKIVVGNCVPGLPVLENRVKGLFEKLDQRSDWEIVGPLDSGLTPDATYSFWETAYTANPDMIMAIGSCSLDLPALYKLKKKYPEADFLTVGYDLEPDALKGIQEGLHEITMGQHPYLQGYLPVAAMAAHLKDGKPLAKGWIDTGREVITQENVGDVIQRESDPEFEYEWYKKHIEENFTPIWEQSVPMSEFID